jgi:hypothetical protein
MFRMVKRYIQSFISMKYVFVLPGIALAVFACAFMFVSTGNPIARYIGIAFGAVLFAVMFFYYKEKISASLQLKKVKDLDDYSDAVMIGQAFFLEDKLLGYGNKKVFELHNGEITGVSYRTDSKGRMFLDLTCKEGILPVEMALKDQAKRVLAFLKQRNPDAEITGLEPAGEGTLHSIDPYRNER